MERGQMIKRKALPSDQSKMYVYVQDSIDKWKREFPLEMAKKKVRNNINSSTEFQRLYMNEKRNITDSKRGVPKNE